MHTTWFVISPHLAAVNQAQSTKLQLFGPGSLGLCAKEKKHSHILATPLGTGKKEREETVPSQSMAPRPRNSKGANMPPTASELVGENEVAFRQRNEIPLVEQEVISGPVAQMAEMLKDLQQEIHLLKEGRT